MKKLFLILSLGFITFNLKAQDTITSDSLITYQYRITFTQINGIKSNLMEDMTYFFKTKIEYYEVLDQYVFITDKDMEQDQFSENFSQEITLFKKIKIKNNL